MSQQNLVAEVTIHTSLEGVGPGGLGYSMMTIVRFRDPNGAFLPISRRSRKITAQIEGISARMPRASSVRRRFERLRVDILKALQRRTLAYGQRRLLKILDGDVDSIGLEIGDSDTGLKINPIEASFSVVSDVRAKCLGAERLAFNSYYA